jgi:hypothetical protein
MREMANPLPAVVGDTRRGEGFGVAHMKSEVKTQSSNAVKSNILGFTGRPGLGSSP